MLTQRWKIHNLEPVRKFLGISLIKKSEKYELNQKEYILTLAKKFGTTQCNPVSKPLSLGVEGLESNQKATNQFNSSLNHYYILPTQQDQIFLLQYQSWHDIPTNHQNCYEDTPNKY